jgi:hypothetical protein
MSDRSHAEPEQRATALRLGSWIGSAACALGIAASVTITTVGGLAIMDRGGFVASGGPYQIAHPAPQGFWILPVAFMGLFAFTAAHAAFASRIQGFRLVWATWCAVWIATGGTTFWYGLYPPGGSGLAWGWLIMGGIFLTVGLVSALLYFVAPRFIELSRSGMAGKTLLVYSLVTASALAGGVFVGLKVFAAVAQ